MNISENVEVTIDGTLARLKNNAGEHMKLITPKYQYDIEKTTFRFENLFNGSKTLCKSFVCVGGGALRLRLVPNSEWGNWDLQLHLAMECIVHCPSA